MSQGRGSAASSLVAYILGITPVDPIRHGLFVGRFLNESSAVPDIDIDIDTQRREEVIQYVYKKYGEEHAAMVCTYVTFRRANAIREVGKVFGFPPHILDRMAKSVSGMPAGIQLPPTQITRTLGCAPSSGNTSIRASSGNISVHSEPGKSRDFPRTSSIHVGGMIVSSKPISEMVPSRGRGPKGGLSANGTKTGWTTRGLIKVDLLGLRMLSLIDEAVRLVKTAREIELDLEGLPEDDSLVYD